MKNDDLEIIEISVKQAESKVELMAAFERLQVNKDFELVFTNGYFLDEPCRIAALRADPTMQNIDSQSMLIKSLDAVGYLRQYLVQIGVFGRIAAKTLEDDIQTQSELLLEEELEAGGTQ